MKCSICGMFVDSIDEAIDQGWIPCFFAGEEEHGPVCFSCSEKLICEGTDGAFELKDEYRGRIVFAEVMVPEEEIVEDVALGFILN